MSTVRVRERDMAVVDRGQRLPLLFIHGYPLDHTMWAAQLDAFAPSRRVIAPDLVGAGQSDPAGRPSLDDHADDLAALLDARQVRRAVVVGLSMGGYVAFGLWRRHADRIGGLVLACTRARADTPVEQEGRHRTAAAVRAHGADDVVEALPPRMLAPDAPAERLEHVRAIVGRQPPEGMAAFLEAMAARRDATADLPGLAIPALVVAGAADALIDRSEVVALAEGLPDARLVVIPGAGHLAPLEEPGAFNAALRSFLERVDADLEA